MRWPIWALFLHALKGLESTLTQIDALVSSVLANIDYSLQLDS